MHATLGPASKRSCPSFTSTSRESCARIAAAAAGGAGRAGRTDVRRSSRGTASRHRDNFFRRDCHCPPICTTATTATSIPASTAPPTSTTRITSRGSSLLPLQTQRTFHIPLLPLLTQRALHTPLLPAQTAARQPTRAASYHHYKHNSCRSLYTSSGTVPHQGTQEIADMAPELDKYYKQVDSLAESFIERLRHAVSIPSISAEDDRRPDVVRMGQFLADELKALGAHVEARPLGKQPHKEHLDLPPVIVARYGDDAKKRTILVYGHYDVQPASLSDGWNTDPFTLSIDSQGRMYGRGSTDDKGPVLGWLNSIQAHQAAGIDFPVNLLMCFEGMEEYGSEGLEEFIQKEAQVGGFFEKADAVCISDNYWLGTEKPCLTYGLRGCNYYSFTVSGPGQDLHSGVFGGSAQEPMVDLVRVLGSLVDGDGKIQVPGIAEMVAPVTEEEKALYPDIAFTMDNLYESLGSKTSIFDDKVSTLMSRWRFPSLSVHGIEGAFSGGGAKTVIPAKVVGKFSVRTVPNMESDRVDAAVKAHVEGVFAKLGSKNTGRFEVMHTGPWWFADPTSWNFSAAAKAVEAVFGVKPDLTREGGSIPVTITFEQATRKNVLLLPMGSSTDAAHSTNEKLDRRNYIEGIKLMGAYLHYVAEEPMK